MKPAKIIALVTAIVAIVAIIASLLFGTHRGTPAYSQVDAVSVAAPQPMLMVSAPHSVAKRLEAGIPQSAGSRTSQNKPQIARTGVVSLFVTNVDDAVSSISALTRRNSGDVLSLEAQTRTEHNAQPSAKMDIRVPDDRFEETMRALGGVGKMRSHSISAEDLSGQIVDSAARLQNLRRTESDIRKIMDRAGSIAQVLDAENQLSSVREQIETLDADLKTMVNRVKYSTVTISMEAEVSSTPPEPSGVAQVGNAWRSALHSVWQLTLGIVSALVWLTAFIPYFALCAIVIWVLNVRARRNFGGSKP